MIHQQVFLPGLPISQPLEDPLYAERAIQRVSLLCKEYRLNLERGLHYRFTAAKLIFPTLFYVFWGAIPQWDGVDFDILCESPVIQCHKQVNLRFYGSLILAQASLIFILLFLLTGAVSERGLLFKDCYNRKTNFCRPNIRVLQITFWWWMLTSLMPSLCRL